HVVEHVDGLDAELERVSGDEPEALEQRKVGPPVARTDQVVARQVAERPYRRPRERAALRADWRRVEPVILRAATGHGIADEIRPVRTGVAVRARVAIGDVERQSALDDRALVDLPSAE